MYFTISFLYVTMYELFVLIVCFVIYCFVTFFFMLFLLQCLPSDVVVMHLGPMMILTYMLLCSAFLVFRAIESVQSERILCLSHAFWSKFLKVYFVYKRCATLMIHLCNNQ